MNERDNGDKVADIIIDGLRKKLQFAEIIENMACEFLKIVLNQ